MNLENQVCSLELARKLKELGVKQDGHFMWASRNNKYWIITCNQIGFTLDQWRICSKFSAFTVAELGEMLPKFYTSFKGALDCWNSCHITERIKNEAIGELLDTAKTEANARAKMLVHLIEKRLVNL